MTMGTQGPREPLRLRHKLKLMHRLPIVSRKKAQRPRLLLELSGGDFIILPARRQLKGFAFGGSSRASDLPAPARSHTREHFLVWDRPSDCRCIAFKGALGSPSWSV